MNEFNKTHYMCKKHGSYIENNPYCSNCEKMRKFQTMYFPNGHEKRQLKQEHVLQIGTECVETLVKIKEHITLHIKSLKHVLGKNSEKCLEGVI